MNDVKDITDYLRATYEHGGSDLHISVNAPPAARIHGAIQPLESFKLTQEEVRDLILATTNETQQATLEDEWELDYALEVQGVGRFRGNVHYCRNNIEAVYRHIPTEVPDLNTLGHYPVLDEICNLQRGLVLVTGITGCGKSTTLASMVKRISETRAGMVMTLEDPIEYRHKHRASLVKQREVGRDTKSFANALRQCMRQDPDVIVVGELRDRESMQIALTAAETGHLVISTLHTIDAPKSVERLMDSFPPDQQQQIASQLSNVLQAVICQRLLPRADGQGRVLATEVMRVTSAIEVCLRDRKVEQLVGLMEIFKKEGNHTIDMSLNDLLSQGAVTIDEVFNHCRDASRFTLASTQSLAG